MSDSSSASSRNVQGYPILIVRSMFPDISCPNGNWNIAIIRTSMKITPKIVLIFFVGINCFGINFPMIWLRVSLPAYLYSVFFGIGFCDGALGSVGLGILGARAGLRISALGTGLGALDVGVGLGVLGIGAFAGVTSFIGMVCSR